jgi:lipopolysaccharide biosynthesis regulator YciM
MGWLSRAFGGDARAPGDVEAALQSALLAVLDRDLDRAESMLAAAVRLAPNDDFAYLALARLYRMRGEIGRAIRIHQNMLLHLDVGSTRGRTAMADLGADFAQGGFLRRAIASYEQVLAQDGKHPEALRALVRLLAEVREFPRAIELARRLAKIERRDPDPSEAELRVAMAEAARAEGRSEEARSAIKKALRRNPGSLRAWIVLGELEAERGRTKAALAAWLRVPELDRRAGPQVYPQLEATYAALGRAREFETCLRGLLDSRPDDHGARLALARTLAARGDSELALAELASLLERDPDDLEARATLGRILLAEARDAEVAKAHRELIEALERQGLLRARESLA